MNYLKKISLQLIELEKFKGFYPNHFMLQKYFTGSPGKFVELEDTIKGFKALCAGEYDHLPEAAFYMVGTMEEAIEKAKAMEEKAA